MVRLQSVHSGSGDTLMVRTSRAELSQHLDGALDAAHLVGIGGRVLGVEVLDDADASCP